MNIITNISYVHFLTIFIIIIYIIILIIPIQCISFLLEKTLLNTLFGNKST